MARRSSPVAIALALSCAGALAVLTPAVAHADEPAADVPAAAQEHYSAGREAYRAGLYGRALEEFERSLALTLSPNTRLYLARTLRELGRWSEAAQQYRDTIREAEERGGRYVATRDAADMELRDVKVRIERGDPSKIEKAQAPVEAPPPAATHPSAPPPPPASSPSSPSPAAHAPSTITWVSGGFALAGAASFGIFYGLAGGRYGYLEDHCTTVRDAACDSAKSTGKTEELVAYISLGMAAAAAVVAVVSLVNPPPSTGTAARAKKGLPWPLAF